MELAWVQLLRRSAARVTSARDMVGMGVAFTGIVPPDDLRACSSVNIASALKYLRMERLHTMLSRDMTRSVWQVAAAAAP
jgi:hypothetical protein